MYHELSRSQRDNVSASKNAKIQLSKVKLKNYPRAERSTWRNVQGHKVKHWNRNNSATDCSIAFKFGSTFHHVTGDTPQMLKVIGQRSRSQRKVMYQQQKCYNTAMDRFSDFKLGKAMAWLGRPLVAIHSQLPRFLLLLLLLLLHDLYSANFEDRVRGAGGSSLTVAVFCLGLESVSWNVVLLNLLLMSEAQVKP